MLTVPAATTLPSGASAGSLHVIAVSPLRAACLPPIFTVALPICMVALLAGGLWNDTPGGVGRCAGVLSAVEPTTAAGCPAIFTVLTVPPLMMPTKGCGSGVGTCAGPAGTITMCVSVAVIWSLALAAGCPIILLVDVHCLPGDFHLGVGRNLDFVRLERQRAFRFHGHVAALLHGDFTVAHFELRLAV